MANWELLPYREEGFKIIRRAQCPFCDYITEFSNSGCDYPPEKCPDCSRPLEYRHKCRYEPEHFCNRRGGCYGCPVRDRETYEPEEE